LGLKLDLVSRWFVCILLSVVIVAVLVADDANAGVVQEPVRARSQADSLRRRSSSPSQRHRQRRVRSAWTRGSAGLTRLTAVSGHARGQVRGREVRLD